MGCPSLQETLTRRIDATGRITFATFMELALYWPGGGYYTRGGASEPARDYFTAPAAHPAFGALLALQLEEMWRLMGRPRRFAVVEPGAGRGHLAHDIDSYTRYLDYSLRQALQYVTVERSAFAATGAGNAPSQGVLAAGLPFRNMTGCILSNELLDALPVHRVTLRAGRLQEIYVTHQNGRFLEVEDEPSTPLIASRLAEERVTLEEGQRAEVCLELERWVGQVAATLERGFVLTIDYGHATKELYSRQRFQGTLRCYYRNTLSGNPYVQVGEQDMTAHVDFTAVAALGARYGLSSQPQQTQASFLNYLGLREFQWRLSGSGLSQKERDSNRMAMLELARPGGMGDFKVLVQSKNVANPVLTGVNGPSTEWTERFAGLPLPLLDEDHLSLMEARYPHTAQSWEQGWPWR